MAEHTPAFTPSHAATLHTLGGLTMGTTWSARVVAPESRLPRLRAAILAELELVDREMSTWRTDSDLTRFNCAAAGEWVALPDACRFVLGRALAHAAESAGAFDPTVGPAVNVWGFGAGSNVGGVTAGSNHPGAAAGLARDTVPEADLVATARASVGWQRLRLVGDAVLQPGGCYLDFSAIAKGYAADRALAALVALGVEHALIEVGGELKARGRRADDSPWRVAVRWPGYADGAGPVIALHNQAIATSGDDFRYFESGGRRYSHTLDPRTGAPIHHELASVTVLHAHAIEADAWATALAVLGPDDGVALARRKGLAALFVAREGDGFVAHPTPAFMEALV